MHGIPVSGGIAIGHAHLVSHARLEVAHYAVPAHQVGEEVARFDTALATVRAELEELRTQIPTNAPQEFDAFLNLHLMILNDATLSKTPREIIETEQCNAEWALKVQMDALLDQALATVEDGRREKLLQQATEVAMADLGIIPLYHQENLWATRRDISYVPRVDERTVAQEFRPR